MLYIITFYSIFSWKSWHSVYRTCIFCVSFWYRPETDISFKFLVITDKAVIQWIWNWYYFPQIVILGYVIITNDISPKGWKGSTQPINLDLTERTNSLTVTEKQASATMSKCRMYRVRTNSDPYGSTGGGISLTPGWKSQSNRFQSDRKRDYKLYMSTWIWCG